MFLPDKIIKNVAFVFSVLVISWVLSYSVLAWSEPGSTPPNGNTDAPINVGTIGQIKSGNLQVNALSIAAAGNALLVPNGNVGIGTTTPSQKLHVVGDSFLNGKIITPNNMAIGQGASSIVYNAGEGALAVGTSALAGYDGAVALGSFASTPGGSPSAIAIGDRATISSGDTQSAIAIGDQAKIKPGGFQGIAIGVGTDVDGNGSVGIGEWAVTRDHESIAIGGSAYALSSSHQGGAFGSDGAIAIGNSAKANGAYSMALGSHVMASEDNAYAIGYNISNSTRNSFMLGINNNPSFFINYNTGNAGVGTTVPNAKLDINSNSFILEQAQTPATSSSSCTVGMHAWDANYIYICVAANTWKRAALSTW